MALEALKKFAEELKSIREGKGISLQQIANYTKIDIKFLQQIEEGNFDILPELYVRAFIKEYAQSIEIDENEIIKKFDIAKGKLSNVKSNTEEKFETQKKKNILDTKKEFDLLEEFDKSNEFDLSNKFDAEEYFSPPLDYPEEKSRKTSFNRYLFLSIAFVVVIIAVYFLFLREEKPDIIEEQPYEDVEMDRFKIDSTAAISESKPLSDSLNLSIVPTNLVWIKVLCDKKEVFQKMAAANQNLNFRASKEFYVVVGNAGNVKMKFNDKPITIGNPGEIRRYFISSDTIRSYLITIPKKDEKNSTR